MAGSFALMSEVGAAKLSANDEASGAYIESHIKDLFPERVTLSQHTMNLDGAYDRCFADKLMRMRGEGKFAGVGMATDESPPEAPRFRGMRFQISVYYWGFWKDEDLWDTSEDPSD